MMGWNGGRVIMEGMLLPYLICYGRQESIDCLGYGRAGVCQARRGCLPIDIIAGARDGRSASSWMAAHGGRASCCSSDEDDAPSLRRLFSSVVRRDRQDRVGGTETFTPPLPLMKSCAVTGR